MSPRGQSQFSIVMFPYGRISHDVKGVSHGKEDAVVLSVHTYFTEEFLYEVKCHTKTLTLTFMQGKVSCMVKVLMLPLSQSHSSMGVMGENSFYHFTLQDIRAYYQRLRRGRAFHHG